MEGSWNNSRAQTCQNEQEIQKKKKKNSYFLGGEKQIAQIICCASSNLFSLSLALQFCEFYAKHIFVRLPLISEGHSEQSPNALISVCVCVCIHTSIRTVPINLLSGTG